MGCVTVSTRVLSLLGLLEDGWRGTAVHGGCCRCAELSTGFAEGHLPDGAQAGGVCGEVTGTC
jgi:hypothetical protein